MRRSLVLLSLATTTLVVVSLLVPLALLVSRQSADRAKVDAQAAAQSVASLVALAVTVGDGLRDVADAVGNLPSGTIVVLDESNMLGEPLTGQGSLAGQAATQRMTIASDVPGGWEVALPVVGADGVAVVDSYVTSDELREGVLGAWLLLGLLALVLIGVAMLVADRLGRRLVVPIQDLAGSAHRLAEGDLDARVEPSEPFEIREVGEAFNYLAGRLELLLAEERESVADVSHRLRTPLTSLRLQADALTDPGERAAMLSQVDRLERATDQVIELARSPGAREPQRSDLDEVVGARIGFWRVLAEEQGRSLGLHLGSQGGVVGAGADEIGLIIDTLVGNVFSHTAAGTGFEIRTGRDGGDLWLEVADDGAGFAGEGAMKRGASGRGSTGLGLDIVAKTARLVGGDVRMGNRPGGGAVVHVGLGRSV